MRNTERHPPLCDKFKYNCRGTVSTHPFIPKVKLYGFFGKEYL